MVVFPGPAPALLKRTSSFVSRDAKIVAAFWIDGREERSRGRKCRVPGLEDTGVEDSSISIALAAFS
jgi:hypothetical protein